jgi:hypothetical protein
VPKGGSMSLTGITPDGKKRQVDLYYSVKHWATPQAHDAHGGDVKRVGRFGTKHGGRNLADDIQLWATPSAADCQGTTGGGQTRSLRDDIRQWPSPASRDFRSGRGRQENGHSPQLAEVIGGQLNPDWEECLMGFDIGYTDIDCPNPQPWPGWPAPLGAGQVHVFNADTGQYPYEPPRVITGQKNRAKRLKTLGNAVSPLQPIPILLAIAEVTP